ncbi:UDP-N-acetylmuramoyl-tripeptide--D-alanyl-D-alanine ligase [Entomomonas asaccharolytica]|uniref:UDP-N-acetylmuramoyl-tripeptide--D-alanyl-D-alanine ligase n=1 Tax=Entomomonas asaccharolytica TaxID=2785331 RepID=A0A974NE66_9GAMM|nr:UDP-N-acetylmuramoyl-tripeptide--D-alanyl-D-alanine ligase [Entomomonas asaccharolytica]QQP84976.1 UDP-N-acetylmuramoyl-tripeptide--D-alanyl-D-alanine ligase [Entomomonas asaccharolytica]
MIKPMSLAELATLLEVTLICDSVSFDAVSIDTRTIKQGELFIAISGENFDGHDYVAKAAENGAIAAMVEFPVQGVDIPQLVVGNTRQALGKLGALNRQAFQGKVIGVTGSSGKTTVKEFIASILSKQGTVHATQGNLNNDLGVPLTLLQLTAEHEFAVIEMGASAIGEINYSVNLVKPDVSVLNNASNAHVGKFGSLENIIEAKGEIIDGLDANGTAILNLDDASFAIWQKRAGQRRVISFAKQNNQADFYASDLNSNTNGCQSFTLHSPVGETDIQLNVLGQHNVSNALAAAAACYAIAIDLEVIKEGLNAQLSVKGRTSTFLSLGGARVIDDSYNASPASVKAAIDLLAEFTGKKILVLGDMGELGQWAEQTHQQIGDYAKGKIDILYGLGPLTAFTVKAFGEKAHHYETKEELLKALHVHDDVNNIILVKGSRSMGMETLVGSLCGSAEGIH